MWWTFSAYHRNVPVEGGDDLSSEKMKKLAILLSLCGTIFNADAAELYYEVTPNKSVFPLPYEFPKIGERSKEDFNWKTYIEAAKSKADRAYRAYVAHWDFGQPVPGGGDSVSDQMHRATLATEEFKKKCDDLIRRYRKKLESDPDVLKDLNNYIAQSEAAIALQVKLVGGSWGGSGSRDAYAKSRMFAYLNYLRNLEALGSSLHLQDLPD